MTAEKACIPGRGKTGIRKKEGGEKEGRGGGRLAPRRGDQTKCILESLLKPDSSRRTIREARGRQKRLTDRGLSIKREERSAGRKGKGGGDEGEEGEERNERRGRTARSGYSVNGT